MSGKRAKALRTEARQKARDGSVVVSEEYKRLKKLYVNPHYSPVINRIQKRKLNKQLSRKMSTIK